MNPTATASFFNIDILTTFEDSVIVKSTQGGEEDENKKEVNGEDQELKPVETNSNGEPKEESGDEHYRNVEV